MSDWVDVGLVSACQENKPVHLELDGTKIIIFKYKNQFYAIENVCTHDGGELSGGCIDGDVIICPRHGARFSIKTGEALSAPAYEPVTTFPTRIENNILQVRDDRWD
jgi:3-phenylpropionate/trans-cinnamate dioxygenase ferredoxin subunit